MSLLRCSNVLATKEFMASSRAGNLEAPYTAQPFDRINRPASSIELHVAFVQKEECCFLSSATTSPSTEIDDCRCKQSKASKHGHSLRTKLSLAGACWSCLGQYARFSLTSRGFPVSFFRFQKNVVASIHLVSPRTLL